MKQPFKNKLIKLAAALWALVAGVDTAGLVDLLPPDFAYGQWVKFGVAAIIVLFGMFGYKKEEATD